MGRNRKKKFEKLPPGVYFDNCRYVLRRLNGKPVTPPVRLGGEDATPRQLWEAWEDYQGKPPGSLEWLCGQYMESSAWAELAAKTRLEWSRYKNRICNARLASGKRLGALPVSAVTPGILQTYMDARTARVAANREMSFLAKVYAWGIARDLVRDVDGKLAQNNPARAVVRNKEGPRTRYVEDWEYWAVFMAAPKYLQRAMELAYLCRMRKSEILKARRDQILEKGFDTLRAKGSRDAITKWSARLRAAVAPEPGVSSMHIVHSGSGQPVSVSAFNSGFRRAKERAGVDFTFHDLKAKGISDAKGDKQAASGHKTPAMIAVYDRKKQTVDPTE